MQRVTAVLFPFYSIAYLRWISSSTTSRTQILLEYTLHLFTRLFRIPITKTHSSHKTRTELSTQPTYFKPEPKLNSTSQAEAQHRTHTQPFQPKLSTELTQSHWPKPRTEPNPAPLHTEDRVRDRVCSVRQCCVRLSGSRQTSIIISNSNSVTLLSEKSKY